MITLTTRIVSVALALAIALVPGPVFADTPDAPDAPKAIVSGSVVINPKDGTQFAVSNDGAFITDAYAQAKLNAFKRVVEERDGFKGKLESRPAYGIIIGVAAGSTVVAATIAVICTLVATGDLKM